MPVLNGKYKILIVEDNPGDAMLIEDLLFEQIESVRTTITTSFKDAKRILTQTEGTFDIILLDLSLPDKAGSELIDETINICNDIPIIVLTGYSDFDFGVESLSLGASDYMLKEELTSINLYKSIIYSLERKRSVTSLKYAEKRYNDLFHLSPLPMWVFDLDTLQFLEVNKSAIQEYGYSLEEFLSMTIKDIRPTDEIKFLQKHLTNNSDSSIIKGIFKHKKKNGELINVEIQSNTLFINDRKVKIVVATNVTDRLNYIKTIEKQIERFNEIAWIQSHIVRAPLARILGLVSLIQEKMIDNNELESVLDNIVLSSHELDGIIADISRKANDINNP